MAIQMRRGQLANYDKNKMLAGEWGIAIDDYTNDQKAFIAFAPGVDKEVMFVEDAQEQIAVATAEAIADATEKAEALVHGNSYHVNDYASGDGTTSSFTLSETPSSVIAVYVDGEETTAYSRSGSTITFTTAPPAGEVPLQGRRQAPLWIRCARRTEDHARCCSGKRERISDLNIP